MFHGQWSSPSLGQVGDKALVFFGGGDGVCYAFEALHAATPKPTFLHKVWSFDCNPPEYRYKDGKPIDYWAGSKLENRGLQRRRLLRRPQRNHRHARLLQQPRLRGHRPGSAARAGQRRGKLHRCHQDRRRLRKPPKSGPMTDIDRSMSTPSIADGLVFIADADGRIHCLDADTGKCYWVHDAKSDIWSSTLVADGKVYIGTRRSLLVFAASKEKKILGEIRLGSQIRSTPAVSDGVLYVASQHYLWAVQKDAKSRSKRQSPGLRRFQARRGG